MSPERLLGGAGVAEGDVWGLGLVIAEAAVGW